MSETDGFDGTAWERPGRHVLVRDGVADPDRTDAICSISVCIINLPCSA